MTDRAKAAAVPGTTPVGRLAHPDTPAWWDWRALLPMKVWHKLSLDHYPGWDRVGKEPPFVLLSSMCAADSHEIAKQFDERANGLFYYRDWTRDGLPFARGRRNCSGFWFERMTDAVGFYWEGRPDGTASWKHDFDERRDQLFDSMGREEEAGR